MDNVMYLVDEKTIERAKKAKGLALIGLIIASAYFIEGMFAMIIALLPLSIFGLIFTIPLNILEFGLMVAAIIVNVMAIIKAFKISGELSPAPDSDEKKAAMDHIKVAKVLSIVGVIVTGVSVVILSFLNIVEIFLSFI